MKSLAILKSQSGASLVTAIIILLTITLIAFLTAKAVLQETKMAANTHRAAQALSAANAGMDWAVAYFDDGGFDHNNDDSVDVIADLTMSLDGARNLQAEILFNNTDTAVSPITVNGRPIDYTCGNTAGTMKSGMIIATGKSDDGEAVRVITQCVGAIDVFGGNGPKQPLISRGNIGSSGNYAIINRFNNTTVWSGGDFEMGNSSSTTTHIRPPGSKLGEYIDGEYTGDYTKVELEDSDDSNLHTSKAISDKKKGNGLDAIANDPRLAELTGDAFFNNFFFTDKAGMEQKAIDYGTRFTSAGSADGKSGIIWIEGNATLNGGTIGTADNPAIFIINGDFWLKGNAEIYGVLYVVGQFKGTGTPVVYGSAIAEGGTEGETGGGGTVRLVYTPHTLDEAKNPLKGLTTVVSGTWRDW